jgi:dipeptidyl aminopeptidase/acylaminoacyl peptidase
VRLRPLAATLIGAALALPATASAGPIPEPVAAPRGYVITIHGGGWHFVGPSMAARMSADIDRLHRWGYGTVNVDYRAGAAAFPDVAGAYDALRARVGPHVPVCAYGASAGGQLALMLAIRRPAVACVVTHAAPTLLASLSPRLKRYARAAFGAKGGLDAWSPALRDVRTPLLLEQAVHDPVVDFSNARAMHRAAPRSRLIALRPGRAPWTHTSVDTAQLRRVYAAERRFLARSTAR